MLTPSAVTSITNDLGLSPHDRQSASRTTRRESATSNATRTQPHTTTAETRHTYVTHLTEFDYPERFVQDQVGHAYASTTSIYSHVSDEYRNRLLRAALTKRGVITEGEP
ncbi:tyrosine-type recombinase/integrase [Mycolicibacterium tusciae]|uniref:tyrosine-type recombinase/integrase n=1 Tax=Mycolicibacterium tusciae TaxID=75922 RepID=UPI000487A889|nr:tyrosine-type recombinase/integrase [Mycolicibacterium tusciae]